MSADERAEAESDRRYPESRFAPENEGLADAFVEGEAWQREQDALIADQAVTDTGDLIAGWIANEIRGVQP